MRTMSISIVLQRQEEWWVCTLSFGRLRGVLGLPTVDGGKHYSRTRAGALSHAFGALAQALEREHHDERRRA